VFTPYKHFVGGGSFTYTCPVYVHGETIAYTTDPTSQSFDPAGAEITGISDLGTDSLTEDNQFMFAGDALISANGEWTLLYLSDGNLVEYNSSYSPVWMTWTSGSGGGDAHVHLQDGNLVVYNSITSPVYTSNTGSNYGAYLVMQNDGNVVIYDSGSTPLWATGIP
jgi:hypothetical protein